MENNVSNWLQIMWNHQRQEQHPKQHKHKHKWNVTNVERSMNQKSNDRFIYLLWKIYFPYQHFHFHFPFPFSFCVLFFNVMFHVQCSNVHDYYIEFVSQCCSYIGIASWISLEKHISSDEFWTIPQFLQWTETQ